MIPSPTLPKRKGEVTDKNLEIKSMVIKIVPISKTPKFIIVTKLWNAYFHYHMDDLSTINKLSDVGVWKIKLKNTKA